MFPTLCAIHLHRVLLELHCPLQAVMNVCSDSLYTPCRLSLLLRNPLQHTSTLNYPLPFLPHFKDRCTHHQPERHLFIISSSFGPRGVMTGWVLLTQSSSRAFLKRHNGDVMIVLDNTHTHTHTQEVLSHIAACCKMNSRRCKAMAYQRNVS